MLKQLQQSITPSIWKKKIINPTYYSKPILRESDLEITEYFPKEVLDYVNTHPSEMLVYQDTHPMNYRVEFYFYEDSVSIETIQTQMKQVVWWLSTIQQFATRRCNSLVLSVYLTPLKKMVPKIGGQVDEDGNPNYVLSAINCNTGYSSRCDIKDSIVVYREEEWFKVFIHESFHYFGLDFAFSQPPFVNTELKKMFCVSSEILLFEAYTEFWAEMIVMMLYASRHSRSFSIIVEEELNYSLRQAKKVLQLQGFTYSTILSPCNKSANHSYKEDTNVFSYYVIKTIFLYFHKDFVDWCIENNHNLLQINPSELHSLLRWIEEHYQIPEFVRAIDEAVVDGDGLRMTTINI